jgi:hypothetical protein
MDEKQKEIIQKVEECYQHSYNELHPLHKKFNEFENMYWAYLPKSKNSAKSNVYDPIAYEMVEHDVSHLVASIPSGYFSPMEPNDVNNAMILDSLIKYQFNRPQANFLQSLRSMRRRASLYGTAFGLLTWRYERKLNKTYGKHYTVHNDPYFEDLDIYRCFPDPDALSVEDMQYFIYDDYSTLQDLKSQNVEIKLEDGTKIKRYINVDVLEKKIQDNPSTVRDSYATNSDRRQGKTQSDTIKRLLIRRYFTRSRWISIAWDYKIVIEDRPNPYNHGELPIHMLRNLDYPGLLYGISDLQPTQKIITAHNQFLNMRLDNVKQIMNPTYLARAKSLKYKDTWLNTPNQIKVVEDLNDLQIDYTPDVTGNTFVQTVNYFNDQIARRIGKTDFLSRTESGRNRTATELKLMAGEQNARKAYKAGLFDDFFKKVMVQAVDLNQQYIQFNKVIRIMGIEVIDKFTEEQKLRLQKSGDELFFTIKPEDIMGRYDYIVATESSVMADKEAQLARLTQALNTVANYAPLLQQEGIKINIKPLIEKYLKAVDIDFTDKIFVRKEQNGAIPMEQAEELVQNARIPSYEGLFTNENGGVQGGDGFTMQGY